MRMTCADVLTAQASDRTLQVNNDTGREKVIGA
jgi:hypothetical protein